MWARKEPIQGIFRRNGDRLLAVCLSESLVSPWSPMLIRVTGWDYFGDSVGADSDLPLQIRRPSSIWFDQVVVVFAQQTQVGQRGGATLLPRDDVMGVAIGCWPVAAREYTAAVAGVEGLPDGGRDEPVFLADIEHTGRSTEHHRQDVCVTRVLA